MTNILQCGILILLAACQSLTMNNKIHTVGVLLAALFTLLTTSTRAATVMVVQGSGMFSSGPTFMEEGSGWDFSQKPTFTGETRFWSFRATPDTGGYSWGVAFGAPQDQSRLSPGLYLGVTSDVTPVAWGPSLSLSGEGRGATTNDGWFEVLEITWSSDFSHIESAAIDFVWGRTGSVLETRGSLRWNSNIPISPIPEPSSLVLVGAGFLALLRRKRKM